MTSSTTLGELLTTLLVALASTTGSGGQAVPWVLRSGASPHRGSAHFTAPCCTGAARTPPIPLSETMCTFATATEIADRKHQSNTYTSQTSPLQACPPRCNMPGRSAAWPPDPLTWAPHHALRGRRDNETPTTNIPQHPYQIDLAAYGVMFAQQRDCTSSVGHRPLDAWPPHGMGSEHLWTALSHCLDTRAHPAPRHAPPNETPAVRGTHTGTYTGHPTRHWTQNSVTELSETFGLAGPRKRCTMYDPHPSGGGTRKHYVCGTTCPICSSNQSTFETSTDEEIWASMAHTATLHGVSMTQSESTDSQSWGVGCTADWHAWRKPPDAGRQCPKVTVRLIFKCSLSLWRLTINWLQPGSWAWEVIIGTVLVAAGTLSRAGSCGMFCTWPEMHTQGNLRTQAVAVCTTVWESVRRAGWQASTRGLICVNTVARLANDGEFTAVWALSVGLLTDHVEHHAHLALAMAVTLAGVAVVGARAVAAAMDLMLTWSMKVCYQNWSARALICLFWATTHIEGTKVSDNSFGLLAAWAVCLTALAFLLFEVGLAAMAYTAHLTPTQSAEQQQTAWETEHAATKTKRCPCFTPGQGVPHMRARNNEFFVTPSSSTWESQTETVPGCDMEACEQRGGRRKAPPPRIDAGDMYFETQVGSHCLVHAWNNMQGGQDLKYDQVLQFVCSLDADLRAACPGRCLYNDRTRRGYYDPRAGNYMYPLINAFLVHRAVTLGAGTVPQLFTAANMWGAATPRRPNDENLPPVSRAAVEQVAGTATCFQVHCTAAAGYGHAVAMRNVQGTWFWIDSEGRGPAPIGDHEWPTLTAGEFQMVMTRDQSCWMAITQLPEDLRHALHAHLRRTRARGNGGLIDEWVAAEQPGARAGTVVGDSPQRARTDPRHAPFN